MSGSQEPFEASSAPETPERGPEALYGESRGLSEQSGNPPPGYWHPSMGATPELHSDASRLRDTEEGRTLIALHQRQEALKMRARQLEAELESLWEVIHMRADQIHQMATATRLPCPHCGL